MTLWVFSKTGRCVVDGQKKVENLHPFNGFRAFAVGDRVQKGNQQLRVLLLPEHAFEHAIIQKGDEAMACDVDCDVAGNIIEVRGAAGPGLG